MKITPIVFDQLPEHDTCWAMIRGSDGRIYTGVCGEITGGMSAYVAGYTPLTGQLDYLVEMASTIGVPADNGQATHSKVHKSLLQDDDGTIYASTHCTGAPLGDWLWRPWGCWSHPVKFFSGSGIVAMRPDGHILFSQILLPHEGSRCQALASRHRKILFISYPKNHLHCFDLETHQTGDFGRIGNINPQCLWLDTDENAYTADDYGEILKIDTDTGAIASTGLRIPHAVWRNGYHNTVYDVVPDPDGERVWGATWTWGQRLFSFDMKRNKLTDYGRAFGEESTAWTHIINDHCGGLVFGPDGALYYVVNRPSPTGSRPFLVRFDTQTASRELIGPIEADGLPGDHISRGACGDDGCLYFAEAGNTPTKLFKCDLGFGTFVPQGPRRMWG